MRTTKQISDMLVFVDKEIKRIGELIAEDGKDDPFILRDGSKHPEWSNRHALISHIAQKSILEWVLNKY